MRRSLGGGSLSYETLVDRYCSDDDTLAAYLKQQLIVQSLSPEMRRSCEYLIGNIDENGYLVVTVEAAAQLLGSSEGSVLDALRVIQCFDPPGVGARDLAECLAIQLEVKNQLSPLAKRVLEDYLPSFEKKSPAQIAHDMGVTHAELEAVLDAIRQCNPYPGAQFGRVSNPIWPEVVVEEAGERGAYAVRLQDFFLPHLQINEHYRTLALSKDCGGAEDYLKEKLKEAEALIANIDYRRVTLYKVACCIVELQSSFFDEGFNRIRPLTMERVAHLTGLSEATISRIANGNYMQTPRGVFELRFFFQAVAASEAGCEVAQASVKHRIAEIIKEEDPCRPLSDQAIAEQLAQEGAGVSRRTVNKYRTGMGIPAQSFRKRA